MERIGFGQVLVALNVVERMVPLVVVALSVFAPLVEPIAHVVAVATPEAFVVALCELSPLIVPLSPVIAKVMPMLGTALPYVSSSVICGLVETVAPAVVDWL